MNNFPGKFWPYKNPEELGFEENFIETLSKYIKKNSRRVKSFIVIKDGFVIFEEYYHQGGLAILNNMMSVTKSVNSLIMGIAIDQGYIDSEEDLVLKYLPEYGNYGELNKHLTIKQILQMSSGMFCRGETHRVQMMEPIISANHPLQKIMEIPLLPEKFNQFEYNTVNTAFLVEIIRKRLDMTYEEFADKFLFSPLGIKNYNWNTDWKHTGYILYMKTTDLARIGLLMLNKGKWQDQRIVSEDWIEKSIKTGTAENYGYQWWLKPGTKIYYAAGQGGQSLVCDPKRNLIAAGNCSTKEGYSSGKRVYELFFDYFGEK